MVPTTKTKYSPFEEGDEDDESESVVDIVPLKQPKGRTGFGLVDSAKTGKRGGDVFAGMRHAGPTGKELDRLCCD